jgi:hypothetical protein
MSFDISQLPAKARLLNPDLFAGTISARPSAEAVGVEAELHEAVYAECRRRGWIAFHGSMAARTHRTLGEPDFVILADSGRVLLIECKTKTGKLSPEQAAMIAHAAKLGHRIHVVRSVKEFLEVVG